MGRVGLEKQLGEAIANARKLVGMTQQELCAKTGLSYSTLAKIERGAIKSPSVFTVSIIAQATNVAIESLISDIPTLGTTKPKTHSSSSGISFVYFDVNGVMVHFFQRAFTSLGNKYGVSPDVIESVFWHNNDDVCRGAISLDEFNLRLARHIGVAKANWQDAYLESVDKVTAMQNMALWAAKFYKIGLLTNIMPGLTRALIDRGTLPNLTYSAIIESCQVGAVKPELAIYQAAAAAANVDPEQILLVDDDRSNLVAAERLGWHVLWFDDFEPKSSLDRLKTMLDYDILSSN